MTCGSYFVSDPQDYFEDIIKYESVTENSPMRIHINRTGNIKIELHLKLNLDITLNFSNLKQWNYMEALKTR